MKNKSAIALGRLGAAARDRKRSRADISRDNAHAAKMRWVNYRRERGELTQEDMDYLLKCGK